MQSMENDCLSSLLKKWQNIPIRNRRVGFSTPVLVLTLKPPNHHTQA